MKNETTKEQIAKLGSSQITENQQTLLMLFGLHASLYSRKAVQESAKAWKINLTDAHKFTFLHCKTEENLELNMNARRSHLHKNNASFLPTIAVFGDCLDSIIDKCFIVYKDIKYEFNNLFEAVDKLLKMYDVLEIPCPGPSNNLFQFMRIILYDFDSTQADSKILSLVKIVQNED